MKIFQPKNKAGFTLVEIMIVVLIIGILLAIAIPNFVAARESSRAKACIGNLKQIDSATQQYCMDQKLNATSYTATPPVLTVGAATTLVGPNAYIRTSPTCPSGGAETVSVGITGVPLCSIGTAGTTTDYAGPNSTTVQATPGKWYHGL